MNTRETFYLVAVHGGAGYHPPSSASSGGEKAGEEEGTRGVKRALRLACIRSLGLFQERAGEGSGYSAVDVVEEAITVLEDAECLNAGYGSNLTLDGTVECDASLMDGRSEAFGAIGAVSGVKNPIKLARAVLENSTKSDPLGRIPPLMLVSNGAQAFAHAHGLIMALPEDSMVSSRARAEWARWKAALDSLSASTAPVSIHDVHDARTMGRDAETAIMQDTVGAVACDANGDFCAGVSSGGLLLKHAGRVGEAAVYGSGCWASHPSRGPYRGIAVSVSGTGEYIMQAILAKAVGEALAASDSGDTHSVLHRVLTEEFYELCRKRGETKPHAGIIVLLHEENAPGELTPRLWCAFTTDSMAVAYASSIDTTPRVLILRRSKQERGNDTAPIYVTALPLARL